MSSEPTDWVQLTIETVGVLASIGGAIAFWYRRKGSRYWPVTTGTVEYGFTAYEPQGWRTTLEYSYRVGSDFYSGDHILKAKNESEADEMSRCWKGQHLTVRYSPRDPAISVIRNAEQPPWLAQIAPKSA